MESSEKKLAKRTNADHVLAACKAAVSGIPVIGGPIASLIGDYIPSATERAFDKAFGELGKRFEELRARIVSELVNKDEFAELFKSFWVITGQSQAGTTGGDRQSGME